MRSELIDTYILLLENEIPVSDVILEWSKISKGLNKVSLLGERKNGEISSGN